MEIRREIKQINCYAGQNRPAWIVIHETDNYSKGAGALKHAQAHKNGNLSTSVHWYVDDTVAVQTLDYSDGAYAVGRQYGTPLVPGVTNTNSINIEICVNSDSDYDQARANCIELVRQIMTELEIPADHVIRHYDAKRKHCPGKMLDQPQLWTDFKAALSEPVKKSGWQQEDGGWRYYLGNGQPVRNDWYWYEGKWYWFDGSGIMVHDTWYKYKDHWYYLGADGAMVTGQQTIYGKWYIMDTEGRMITEPVTLTPDQDGALRWPGLAE